MKRWALLILLVNMRIVIFGAEKAPKKSVTFLISDEVFKPGIEGPIKAKVEGISTDRALQVKYQAETEKRLIQCAYTLAGISGKPRFSADLMYMLLTGKATGIPGKKE